MVYEGTYELAEVEDMAKAIFGPLAVCLSHHRDRPSQVILNRDAAVRALQHAEKHPPRRAESV